MTNSETPAEPEEKDRTSDAANTAQKRLADISVLFVEMHELLKAWRASEQQGSKAVGQKMLAKMGELQTAHLLLLRAEEAFHDKYDETTRDGLDYDLIRHDIGRSLDRIRASLGTDDIS